MSNTTTLNEALRSPIDGTEFVRLATPGANWKAPLNSISRQKLTAAINNYYVSSSGSDSTGTGSSGNPWATPQHAANYIAANIDIAATFIFVNIGAGSFQGVECPTFFGGGTVFFKGAGSASTTIGDSPNAFGCFTNQFPQAGTSIGIDAVTFNINAASIVYAAYNPGTCYLGDAFNFTGGDIVIGGNSANKIAIQATTGGIFNTIPGAAIAISGSWGQAMQAANGGVIVDGAAWTLNSTPSFSSFVDVSAVSQFISSGPTYTGAATGKRFTCAQGGVFYFTGSLTLFPGNAAGTISSGGIYT